MTDSTTDGSQKWIRAGTKYIHVGPRTLIMGILNITPDSFFDGGLFLDPDRACEHAEGMVEAGASIIDVGAESTRPGADSLSVKEEIERIRPILSCLGKHLSVPISVDTQKASVARLALDLGASMINDVSAMRHDPEMGEVVARAKAGVVLMHMKGTPQTMKEQCTYVNVVEEVKAFLADRVKVAENFGIGSDQIIIDPGIGFAKNTSQNLRLLNELPSLIEIGCPVLVGASNKSFIGQVLDKSVVERMVGTAAVVATAVCKGAKIVRVHDVESMNDVVRMVDAIQHPSWN